MSYQTNSKLSKNEWITNPQVKDPENLPEPLGWTILVRPYPVKEQTKAGIILASESIDYINGLVNVGRVVKIGPCAYMRPDHKIKGEQKNWVEVGDFVSWPRHVGAKRKFKGVSFVVLNDDELVEKLPDPMVFNEESFQMEIPEEDLKNYNTIYNPNYGKE